MYIALDANILIQDLWFHSQNMRLLLDFTKKTNSTILLHRIVEAEVKAKFRRELLERVGDIEKAIFEGNRFQIIDLPQFQAGLSNQQTFEAWEELFAATFNTSIVEYVPTTLEATAEGIRRATRRIAPCNEKGDGLRDTMIWIDLVSFHSGSKEPLYFISQNTNDFGKAELKPRLKDDLKEYDIEVEYYTTLKEFIDKHVQPIMAIKDDREWVLQKLSMDEVKNVIYQHIKGCTPRDYNIFSIQDEEYREIYRCMPDETPSSIEISNVEIEKVVFWEYTNQRIELLLECTADIEAEIFCEWQDSPAVWPNRYELLKQHGRSTTYEYDDVYDSLEEVYPSREVIPCSAKVYYELIAELQNDDATVRLKVEDVYSR